MDTMHMHAAHWPGVLLCQALNMRMDLRGTPVQVHRKGQFSGLATATVQPVKLAAPFGELVLT